MWFLPGPRTYYRTFMRTSFRPFAASTKTGKYACMPIIVITIGRAAHAP